MADFFISYTSADRDWAFWIAKELEALGHAPRVHEWEIKSGDDIYAWMEQRHDAADHVLCVVSDDYLKAPYSTLERNAALWRTAGQRPGFVLFVAVKPCKLPSLSDHIRRCEIFGVPEDAARTRFRAFMAERAAPAAAAFPGKVFAVSNIPIRVPTHFLGRDDSLAAIDAALKRYEGRVAITALHGLRGVGKTTLAAAYAEKHRGDYRATWWIRGQTESGMRADLTALGVRLKWIAPDEKEEAALAAMMERLRHEGEGILLIYDNVVDPADIRTYLPKGGGARVLVTSNAHAWRGIAEPVEIRLWPKQIVADYLVLRTGRDSERAAAEALSQALGGLPLAHEQAAAYCERLEISLADYHKRFDATPARMLDDSKHASSDYQDGLTVAKTFALAIEKAAKLHPAAEPLIVHAAYLAPDAIPLFLFSEGREKLGEPLATLLADDGLIEAVAALRAFALVDREAVVDERDASIVTDTIRVHRLVREVAMRRREGQAAEDVKRGLLDALEGGYPEDVYRSPNGWSRARRLDALAMVAVGDGEGLPATKGAVSKLLNELACYRHSALAAYGQAKILFERSLAIREKTLGPEHPDVAMSLNNLASLFQAQGDLVGARPLHERALAIYEKALGPDHLDVALSSNNLACVLRDSGQAREAEPLFRRSIEIGEKVFGADHLNVATNYSNLACLLRDTSRAAEAEPLFLRAIASGEKALGADHILTRRYQSHYARLFLQTGRASEALALGETALRAHEAASGLGHAWTKDSARVTADALDALGRADEAAALRARV